MNPATSPVQNPSPRNESRQQQQLYRRLQFNPMTSGLADWRVVRKVKSNDAFGLQEWTDESGSEATFQPLFVGEPSQPHPYSISYPQALASPFTRTHLQR